MKQKRDLARLTHLLRVCAYTAAMIATAEASADMVRLSELARRVEAIADEMDDFDDEGDPTSEKTRASIRRRKQ